MAIGRVNTGGSGSGGTLTVTGIAGHTVTATKDGKTYTRTFNNSGVAVFKGLSTGTWTVKMSGNGQTATRTVTITADYSLTIAYFSATIKVTYPAKSKCIIKNSSGTQVASDTNTGTAAKTWTATVNAKGTYTVTATATDGSGNSKSQSVEITAEGQSVSVELSYRYYLFKEGSGAQNGFTFNAVDTGLFSVSASKIVFSDNAALYNGVWATPTLNLSKYSTLKFELQCGDRWGSDRYVTVGVGRNAPSGSSGNVNPGDWTAKTGNIYETTRAVYSVDVSTLTSALYVKLHADAITGKVYNIWLE